MLYDPSNPVVLLCVKGIETEYAGNIEKADGLYREAWSLADTDLEKMTAAHYLARTRDNAAEALHWNLLALDHAGKIEAGGTMAPEVAALYPSLHLNVAKSFEDGTNPEKAREHYLLAGQYTKDLPADGYGEMISKGIAAGLARIEAALAHDANRTTLVSKSNDDLRR